MVGMIRRIADAKACLTLPAAVKASSVHGSR